MRAARAVAGPFLIVVGVLVVLHEFVFSSRLTTADVLRYWMPTYCFLGRSLAAGHVPLWNPYTMAGAPFAADPQSGWMYAPAMALFSTLSCGLAIRAMIVLQPILAGLGVYAFCRAERTSRAAATTGGATLALLIAGSELSLSLPFAGALAWAAISLAALARFVRAPSTSARLGWGLATTLAWGQLAAAHFSVGLVIGTLALVAYAAGALPGRGARALVATLCVVPAAAVVNLAYLLPRIAYLPSTTLGLGYARLDAIGRAIAGRGPAPFGVGPAAGPAWPLALATSSGAHAGAVALAFLGVGWWSRRRRPLVAAFSAFGFVCYLLSLHAVANAIPAGARSSRILAVYLHSPEWFAYGTLVAIAVLAGLGVAAWQDEAPPRWWLAPAAAAVLWGIGPLVLGAPPPSMILLAGGAIVLAAVVWRRGRTAVGVVLVSAVAAIELVANGLLPRATPPFEPAPALLASRSRASVDPDAYLRPGPLDAVVARRDGGRTLTVADVAGLSEPEQFADRELIPNLAEEHGVETISTFEPVQLLRYWILVRGLQRAEIRYNRSVFLRVEPPAVGLFAVQWVVVRADRPAPANAVEVAVAGRWALFEVQRSTPVASLVERWTVVPAQATTENAGPTRARATDAYPSRALAAVTSPRFDSTREVVLETRPFGARTPPNGSGRPSGARSSVVDRALGPEHVSIGATSPRAAVLVVRNPYARGWRATLDGRPVAILHADYLFQGVAIPPGRHVVDLRYDDPTLWIGLLGSVLAVGCAGALALVAFARERRHTRAIFTSDTHAAGRDR